MISTFSIETDPALRAKQWGRPGGGWTWSRGRYPGGNSGRGSLQGFLPEASCPFKCLLMFTEQRQILPYGLKDGWPAEEGCTEGVNKNRCRRKTPSTFLPERNLPGAFQRFPPCLSWEKEAGLGDTWGLSPAGEGRKEGARQACSDWGRGLIQPD